MNMKVRCGKWEICKDVGNLQGFKNLQLKYKNNYMSIFSGIKKTWLAFLIKITLPKNE